MLPFQAYCRTFAIFLVVAIEQLRNMMMLVANDDDNVNIGKALSFAGRE
jgi:hypothetical protein